MLHHSTIIDHPSHSAKSRRGRKRHDMHGIAFLLLQIHTSYANSHHRVNVTWHTWHSKQQPSHDASHTETRIDDAVTRGPSASQPITPFLIEQSFTRRKRNNVKPMALRTRRAPGLGRKPPGPKSGRQSLFTSGKSSLSLNKTMACAWMMDAPASLPESWKSRP